MSSDTIVRLPDQATARIPKDNYLTRENGILSWLLTSDHKRIAILYLASITFFFFIGGALAGLIRPHSPAGVLLGRGQVTQALGVKVHRVSKTAQAKIEAAACQGCGVCVCECPAKAITLHHYTDAQIFAKEEALFMEVS